MYNYFNGKGTIGFTCDNCGREINGCSIVNGMKFCAKCYQETFGKDNQQGEIKQLRQQLKQVQTRIKELEDKDWYEACIKQLEEQNDRLIQERDNLKQQLANKMEELHIAYCSIEDVKTKNGELKAGNKILKEFADKLDEEFGKNVEPTLSEKVDNIIALYRTNKKYCEIADEKIKKLKHKLEEKDEQINNLEQICQICNKDQENEVSKANRRFNNRT